MAGLSIVNPRPTRLSGPSLLHHLIAAPSDRLALDQLDGNGNGSFTYRGLHEAAAAIASLLTDAVRSTERSRSSFIVPVLVPQSSLLCISLLAVLKAGGAFCPLNLDSPRERIRFIVKDVSATVVLVTRALAHLMPVEYLEQVIVVDDFEFGDPSLPAIDHLEPAPEDLAYVMYTSGSTGTPKGVCISHDAVTQALLAHDRHIPAFSRFLQFAAPTFDVSVFEIFFPLFRGSTLVTANRDELLDDLPAVIRRMDVDACELTPTVAASLLRRRHNAPALKLLLTIGEMLTLPVVEEFGGSETRPSMLWAMYGPTEAAIHCTLQAALPSNSPVGNIGVPLDTVSCFVVDTRASGQGGRDVRVLPRGEIGELAVGGHQLASSYLNRPEQTASAFIATPYGRLYLTGDRARMTPDGILECLGRLTGGQLKLRGQRIETGEVEQSAMRASGCHGAVVAVVDANLVLFCAVDPGTSEDDIATCCKSWLPRFMVPREIVLMAEFPCLPSGKVDKRKLKSLHQEQKSTEPSEYDEKLLAEEHDVLRVISSVLGRRVSRQMALSSAGIDSLSAIKLASALRSSGFSMEVSDVLSLKTVADLCCQIRKPLRVKSSLRRLPSVSILSGLDTILAQHPGLNLKKENVEDVISCTPLQTALLAETARDPLLYCNQLEFEVAPGFTVQEVSAAICRVAAENEVLRSGFVESRGGYAAILFRMFKTDDNLRVVSHFDKIFSFQGPNDFLRPFRVQICDFDVKLRVLFQVHHAVYDGWSMDLILSDLSALLRRQPLSPRPQFREVLRHHLRDSKDVDEESAMKFWGEHLTGWNKSSFPKLAARLTASNEINQTSCTFQIPPSSVRKLAGERAIGAQVLFQASLALLWSGIAGEQDLVLGSVTSGRTIPVDHIEEIFGPCFASLPIRIDLSNMASGKDLLASIQASNRAIMQHCTLPLSGIRTLAGLQPSESLYDVLLVYQESLESLKRKDWLFAEVNHLDRLETKLLLEIQPHEAIYSIQATYHSSFFAPELVECLLQQLEDMTRLLLENPDACLQSIRSAAPGKSVHNIAVQPFHGVPDLAAQFEATAAAIPTATALCFCESLAASGPRTICISYGELNKAANRVARYLCGQAITVAEVLAVLMQKSPAFYTVVLGIQKAGCAYLPILPQTPEARIRTILEQAGVKHCLVENSSIPSSPLKGVQIHDMNRVQLQQYSSKNPNIPRNASRLAYVVYTSGTTGVPKGVSVTQENIVSNITVLQSTYPTPKTAEPRLLQACSQAFDVSVFEIFFAWHAGMCLCAAPNDVLFQDLERFMRLLKISHLSLTPTLASLIEPANVPEVEFLVTAGEPMTLAVLNRWHDRLWQGYGPSETTNICSVKHMARGDNIEHLGWALPNTSSFVMRPGTAKIVPVGWVGELCFGGHQVARGYLNDNRLTREKFLHDPTYGRIYRSGDLGRMLPDGSLVILGRLDDQIKLRGQRIAAGEINSIITSTGLATTAVTVAARRRTVAPEQLVSFFVTSGTRPEYRTLDISPEVNRHLFGNLQCRLPPYMVPSYLIPVSQIPMTASGKVDWRRLRTSFEDLTGDYAEAASSTTQSLDGVSDWTHTESIIADVISRSTKVPRYEIRRWTPFAALGVDSVAAIELSRLLSSRLENWVSISLILQSPSVAQLAKSLGMREEAGIDTDSSRSDVLLAGLIEDVGSALGRDPEDVEDILPCTPLQEAMLSRGTESYYNKILLRIRIQAEDMKAYWEEMSKRHGILRTCFVTTRRADHSIAQVILRRWRVPWKTYDVQAPSLAGVSDEHLKCLPEPLDSGLPPISCAIMRYKGSTFFSLICHHAMYDGVAMDNLWREIEALANHRSLPPPVPYKPFLKRVVDVPADTEAFWLEQFNGFRPCRLFTRLAGAQANQCIHTRSFDMTLTEVQERSRGLGLSLLSACQTAWATLLSAVCEGPDVAFGIVVNGRIADIEGLDRLVAPCFNTIAMRVDVSSASRNIDVARKLQDLNVRMIPYQFTPLRKIQKVVDCGRRALFDTLLLLQQPLKEMDDRVWTLEEDSGNMDVPLVCEIVPCPNLNSIVLNIHYDIGIVSRDVTACLADAFIHTFRRLMDVPLATPSDKSTMPEALRSGLVDLIPRRDKPKDKSRGHSEDEIWTDTEKKIQAVFSELSGVPPMKISRDISIFQLGLDSINAVQVASMLRREGYLVSASEVMECADCANLARRLLFTPDQKLQETAQSISLDGFANDVFSQIAAVMPSIGDQVETILPATPMQSAMLASFISSKGHNYLNRLELEMNDTINVERLEWALAVLQRKHPMLRTGFVSVRHAESSFAMIQYGQVPGGSKVVESFDLKRSQIFDLSEWQRETRRSMVESLHLPLWKAVLVKQGNRLTLHFIMHHALYDAHSLNEILQCLSSLLLYGKEPRFSKVEPALNEVLNRSLRGQEAAQAFWTKHASNTVVNRFPCLTPLREDTSGLLTHETISIMSCRFLFEAAQNCGCSIQALVQAAWTRVLASYHGENSVVFGITLSGRVTDDTRAAPFPCIVTIPVVARNLDSNREIIDTMMKFNAEMHKHQFAPLSRIQKWLGHPATTVFDTIVVYQKGDRNKAIRSPWRLVKDEAVVDYAISLEVEPDLEDGDRMCLRLTFARNLIPEEQARLIVQQFDATLHHLASEPAGNEAGLYRKRPELFSVTPASMPDLHAPVQFLHEFVENSCKIQPEAIALEFLDDWGNKSGPKRWSYRELDLMGNRVANQLREHVEPGDIVALHFQKCAEAYFSILGILKAGCAFVALDPHGPKARKDFILRDSQARCLLAEDGVVIDLESPIQVLGIAEQSLRKLPDHRPAWVEGSLTPGNTCYCLYTSGTTGTPKGCEISHENAVQAMMAFQDLFKGHWDADSRWLQFAALHFDVSVLEQYLSWSVGITVVSAPRDLILDDLAGAIRGLGITHVDLTPSLARLTSPEEMPGLRVFITGGEQLKQEILDRWGPRAVIYNAYGPTEATIGVTTYPRVPVNGRPTNIGRQFPNVGSYVFRPLTEAPVLRGAVGELCVSGKLVGKGYLGRPDLSEERFPELAEFGERVYRTGDLVRILHDGCFEFLGRADDQIKLRGQRLEMGEINHAIRAGAADVLDCVTLLVHPESSDKDVLVSFVVRRGSGSGPQRLSLLRDEEGIGAQARSACVGRLPAYMVPSYFLRVSSIPLSANNKVEAKELKALFQSLSHEELVKLSASAAALPSGVDEVVMGTVINIVAEFSGVAEESITSSTSLFDVGVDSISALQLTARLRQQGFKTASPSLLLSWPVIAHLVKALAEDSASDSASMGAGAVREAKQSLQACRHRNLPLVCRELDVGPADVEYIAPCSPLQQGIIFKALADDGSESYFSSFEIKLSSGVSVAECREAWSRTVDAHAILRSVFVNTPDGHVQVAMRRIECQWQEVRFESEEELGLCMELKRRDWVARNRHHLLHPLELIQADGPDSHRLFLHLFHGLYDGTSLRLVSKYAMALYRTEEPLSGPPFIEALVYGPLSRHDDCRQFWKKHMDGWMPSPMPRLAKSSEKPRGVIIHREVPLDRLERLRRQQNVTMQSVVLALWASVLERHLADSVTVGVILSGRSIDLAGVEGTIGPLFNTVPLFIDGREKTWSSLIREVHAFNTAVMSFQHVPLKDIQRWCSEGRPLFDNLFAFQLEQRGSCDEAEPWHLEDGADRPDYPLALEATRTLGGNLRLCLVSQSSYAGADMLEDMLNEFERATEMAETEGVVQSPRQTRTEHSQGAAIGDAEQDELEAVFDWTEEAVVVREEISLLARVTPEQVSATTRMLELGLDSVDGIKLSSRLRKRGINLSTSDMLRSQTIARLVGQLKTRGVGLSPEPRSLKALEEMRPRLWIGVERAGVEMETVESILPPTPLQEAMVAGMVRSCYQWYFNHDVLEVADWVDMKRLGIAWRQLVEASPCLRTGFIEVGDSDLDMSYCQVIFKSGNANCVKMQTLSDESETEQLTREATSLAARGKGLRDLVQVVPVTVGGRRLVVVSMAHALYDGWSLGLLNRHLEALYWGRTTETRASADGFVERVLGSRTDEARGFWAGHLAGLRPTILKGAEKTIGDKPLRREARSVYGLPRLMSFCKGQAISLQVLCVAAWAAVAAERTRGLDVVFGLVLSGRDGEGAEDLVFPTMSTVALRCVLHASVSGFLGYLEQTVAEVRGYQHYPLRRAQVADAFNSLFLFQKAAGQDEGSSRLLRSVDGRSAAEYPVCVEAEPVDQGLVWRIACHGGLFSDHDAEMLLERLDRVLGYMMGNEATALLSFQEKGVSICGLPVVTMDEEWERAVDSRPEVPDDEASREEEWGETAMTIRDVLSLVSGVAVESIKLGSSLYQLGLDSISAVKVSMLLRKRDVRLTPRELIKLPSLREMAGQARPLERVAETKKPSPCFRWKPPQSVDVNELMMESGISLECVEAVFPATPMQVYMLTAWEKPGGAVFFPEFGYRLDGTDDVGRVREAWEKLSGEVAVLRTRFLSTGSDMLPWVQVVMSREAIRENIQPLARLRMIESGSGRGVELRLKIHHALYDGISLQALMARLRDLVNKSDEDSRAQDYEDGLSRWALYCSAPSDGRERRREFWTEYLKGGTAVDLAASSSVKDSTERTSYLDESAIQDVKYLRATASRHDTSLQALVLAALATSLDNSSLDTARSLVMGIYLANRAGQDFSPPWTYPTLSLVPLRIRLGPGLALVDVARAIQADVSSFGDEERAGVGLWEISAWTGVRIACFVNFVVDVGGDLSMGSFSGGDKDEAEEEEEESLEGWTGGMRRNVVSEAMEPSVDLEASVKGKALAVGVFGPSGRVSTSWAAGLVAETVGLLEGVANGVDVGE
ncbi:non-ribosomal peptide synthetase, siderophore synthesis [Ophiocordyceps camponoti-floridani]|uniref:Non-ribosomal peptide synthetase, siderophore synthesis n=1 Tax=Ophiocordyceps camponoti-floridani TaxID=2030778 RepID=A0A8H4QDY4_9HYPO|nr:non-ribosomal peptide synthetase, siderophore synthesis [Ophiocordyceps camponoti-floridani]